MKTSLVFLLLGCSFLLASCYTPRYVYSPSAHNVPVFTKKGDSKLAANYSANIVGRVSGDSGKAVMPRSRGYDLQAAYAFTNHWAMQVNYFHRNERNTGDDLSIKDSVVIRYKRSLTEAGIGYFHILDRNKRGIFQVFAGVGLGKSSFIDNGKQGSNPIRSRYHEMNVTKLFIQPAFMITNKGYFAAAISSRVSVIYFSKIKTDYNATELSTYQLDSLNYSPRVFWEPAVINSFGFKKLPGLKLEFQFGFSFLASKRFVDSRAFNFSGGLLFDLPKLFAFNKSSSKN